jgi:hypothetical protein
MNPKSVIGSLISWEAKYGVHIIFADGRRNAAVWVKKLLLKFWEYHG